MKVIIANGAVADPNTVTMKKGAVDEVSYSDNMKGLIMYAAPVFLNDRTLVSARAAAEAFDADVQWDEATQTVKITGDTTGVRKSEEELQKIERFNREALDHMIANMTNVEYFGGLPEYDSKGKYFEVEVEPGNIEFYDAKMYSDGTIIRE